MLSSGAQRLASLYGVRPGKAAVVATVSDRGLEAALALHAAGVAITAVADARPTGRRGPQPRASNGRASATCPAQPSSAPSAASR